MLNALNTVFTIAVYISYPAFLIFLFVTGNDNLLRCTLVPAVSFAAVSVLRKIINRARPYEKLDIDPIIKKDKTGESMPSRHVFSVFVIAFAFMYFKPLLSLPFFVVGIILSFIRIVGGVHYPSDVAAGALIGITAGLIGLLF